jgi:hypothetical protein
MGVIQLGERLDQNRHYFRLFVDRHQDGVDGQGAVIESGHFFIGNLVEAIGGSH